MKRVLPFLLTVVLLMTLCAGATADAVDGAGKVVGVATQHMGNAWNKNCVQAIKDTLEPLGFTVEHQDGGGDTAQQVAAVENFITKKVDFIIVSGGEGGAFNEASLKARDAGIPVIGVDMFLDGAITGIMCDNWSGGVQMGIYAANMMQGAGKYILLDTSGWATLLDRGEAAESVLSSFSKISKVGETREVAASDPVTQGYDVTKAALTADPDIKAVLVTWNMPAVGVYNALLEMNKVEDVTIISADTGDDVISAMLEDTAGHWGFMGQNSYELGTMAANSVITTLQGGAVPFAQIGTSYFVSNDDYVTGGIKTVKIQTPAEHWSEVLQPVLGPLEEYLK
ncbi:MAG: sugar ABC transporter substrate-binding protein [Clostridiales bacterium]|nr:sugar ABC transporter substrate-binding protein [Clostridiales bacterium]